MKILKNDKGYALFITLAIIILFTVLGMTILTLTMNGTSKNEIRQDNNRSSLLAEKGIARLTQQINSELTKALGIDGLSRDKFKSKLINTLDQYLCSGSNLKDNKGITGDYKVCIENPYTDTMDANGKPNPLRKEVTFRSLGKSGSAEKTLMSVIEIGAESVPETMKYAIGTNIMTKDRSKLEKGEGNLLLHGGVHIEGDMKVDGTIITYDHGYAYLGGEKWIASLPPSTMPTNESTASKIVLGECYYKITSNPSNYQKHIENNSYKKSEVDCLELKKFDELFEVGKAPRIVKRDPVVSPIAIAEQKSNFYYNYNSGKASKVTPMEAKENKTSYYYLSNSNYSSIDAAPVICDNQYYCNYYDFRLYNKNNFKSLSTNESVTLRSGNHTFEDGLYVGNNLTIGNMNSTYTPSQYDDIELEGNIYVGKDVTIQGANLTSNVIMYVEGDVTIKHTTINGKKLNEGKTGSLIIFAKGNIYLANNSVNQDDHSTIKGFFYSEKNFEMFGVGSNMKVEGGISARRIVLNAIRGRARATDKDFKDSQKIYDSYFESVAGQKSKNSRLQIVYDPSIIEIFSNLKKQEPIILRVDPPTEIERREITIKNPM